MLSSSSLNGAPKQRPPIALRDTLFGDLPLDQWPQDTLHGDIFPWSAFVSARVALASGNTAAAIDLWKKIAETPELESRHAVQAWNFLRAQGCEPAEEIASQVLGIVVEVGMPEGLDLLAAYADHSARYYNYSGSSVVWDYPDTSLDARIEQLLAASAEIVAQIGPWDDERPAAPQEGYARLSFLTPSGLHFGEGPMDVLSQDPLGMKVFGLAADLMQALIGKTGAL